MVLIGTGAIAINEHTQGLLTHIGVSFAFGFAVFAMIYYFGKISGAHINPVVSIGLWLNGKFTCKQLTPYIIAQLLGAVTASALVGFIFTTNNSLGTTLPYAGKTEAFIIELIFTFILVQAILIVDSNNTLRKHIALIIGLVIFAEAFLGGPISGASMNPARSIGPAVIAKNFSSLWIYLLAPLLGAIITIFTHKQYQKLRFNKIKN